MAIRTFEKISNHSLLEGIIYSKDKSVPFYLRNGLGYKLFQCNIAKPAANLINESTIQNFMEKNIQVLPWCIDDEKTAIELVSKKVFGIITNVPEKLIKTNLFKQ
jgi:glycerophosphoryl diester phosphodiesterase